MDSTDYERSATLVTISLQSGTETAATAVLDALGSIFAPLLGKDPIHVGRVSESGEMGPSQVWAQTFDTQNVPGTRDPVPLDGEITAFTRGHAESAGRLTEAVSNLFAVQDRSTDHRSAPIGERSY